MRSAECSRHQLDRLLQHSLVRRASSTATRNAQSVGADDVLVVKIQRRHQCTAPLLFNTLH